MTGTNLILQVRTEIEDELYSTEDLHEYKGDNVFKLWESNADSTSLKIYINGTLITEISGATYIFNTANNKITISYVGLVLNDSILFEYNYYPNYSDATLKRYISISLGKISIYYPKDLTILDSDTDFTIIDSNGTEIVDKYYALVSYITALLIKPDWSQYRAADLGIRYNERDSVYDLIKYLIDDFKDDIIGVCSLVNRNLAEGELD